jgi:hypothetical protein
MTLLIATIGEDFAFVSQDTAIYEGDDANDAGATIFGTSRDAAVAAQNTFVGDGQAPTTRAVRHGAKMMLLPNLNAVLFGAGNYAPIIDWGWICQAGMLGAVDDVIGMDLMAPRLLPKVKERLSPNAPFLVCHVGWSERDGRMAGFAYNSADGFRSTPLGPGHTMMPIVDAEMPGYELVYRARQPASRGERTADFHVAVAKNQFAAWRAGKFRPGSVIGGQLHTARIDRHGLSVRVTHTFPDPEAERQAGNPYWPFADYDGPAEPERLN